MKFPDHLYYPEFNCFNFLFASHCSLQKRHSCHVLHTYLNQAMLCTVLHFSM